MSKKILFVSVMIVLLLVGSYYFVNQRSRLKNTAAAASSSKTVTFNMTASNFQFSPAEMIVKKGDNVLINLTGKDAVHSLAINGYGINQLISPGETKQIKFIADKVGTFTFFCAVPCGTGHYNMTGSLVVQL